MSDIVRKLDNGNWINSFGNPIDKRPMTIGIAPEKRGIAVDCARDVAYHSWVDVRACGQDEVRLCNDALMLISVKARKGPASDD